MPAASSCWKARQPRRRAHRRLERPAQILQRRTRAVASGRSFARTRLLARGQRLSRDHRAADARRSVDVMTAIRASTRRRCCRSPCRGRSGLGTLGLNLQLLTPEYGPRVLLTAILCSLDVACDQKMETALCHGPSCGRCLKTCPADAVGHWTRDWPACDRFRSPHGFAQLSEHVARIIAEPDAGATEGIGSLRGQLQSLAEYFARRRRHYRLPPLCRRLSGRRRLCRDARRRARSDSGGYAGERGAARRDGKARKRLDRCRTPMPISAAGSAPCPRPRLRRA